MVKRHPAISFSAEELADLKKEIEREFYELNHEGFVEVHGQITLDKILKFIDDRFFYPTK